MKSKEKVNLYVIPDDCMSIEGIRPATKEELEKEYLKIKSGDDSKILYVILYHKVKSFTISESEEIRLATRSEIKRAYRSIGNEHRR